MRTNSNYSLSHNPWSSPKPAIHQQLLSTPIKIEEVKYKKLRQLARSSDNGLKWIMDKLISGVGLVITLPLTVPITLAILVESGRPVFFVDTRVGKQGKTFPCFKFRSMHQDAHPTAPTESSEDPRITKVGRVLRKYSLDELPQLLNVLIGHMSCIGPRPIQPHLAKPKDSRWWNRIRLRPGMSGLSQVTNRNINDVERHLENDQKYYEKRNIFYDLWLILRSFRVFNKGR